jgi:glycosyltransferase involved in cell wall biosynthesis
MIPFFSIVIPTLNEEVNLPILLESIAAQTETDFEVIVSDSGSKDKTKEKAGEFVDRIPNLRFLDHHSKNVSQARNFGASNAIGTFFVFFDADVEIETNFFKEIKEKIVANNLDATTVWNRDKTNGISGKLMLGLLNLSMDIFQSIKPVANGPCILMKKMLFEELKGFDDSIVFGEDFDLMQRASKIGMKFKVFKKPILYVSPRRFEQEGFLLSLYKSLKALVHQILIGPIRKPIFKYEMGGQEFDARTNKNN